MARRAHDDELRRTLGELIEGLALDDARKRYMKERWLDQVVWLGGRASTAQRRYYRLRLLTVVGAVVVPALVGLNLADDTLDGAVTAATWVVSLVTAASAAVEGFFRFGERWRNYRGTAERLKTEGWLYFQLGGPYAADGSTHDALYPSFAHRVEEILGSDVSVYLTEIAVEREKQDTGKTSS